MGVTYPVYRVTRSELKLPPSLPKSLVDSGRWSYQGPRSPPNPGEIQLLGKEYSKLSLLALSSPATDPHCQNPIGSWVARESGRCGREGQNVALEGQIEGSQITWHPMRVSILALTPVASSSKMGILKAASSGVEGLNLL